MNVAPPRFRRARITRRGCSVRFALPASRTLPAVITCVPKSSMRCRALPALCASVLLGSFGSLLSSHALARDLPSMRDPQDGAFDLSAVLDTTYGFVPLVSPITEPAVGYGAAGALVFVDRNDPVDGQPVRPNLAAVGGMATANGSQGYFAGHIGNWRGGRLRTSLAVADAQVNLEYFGLGQERDAAGNGLRYSVSARGGVAGGSYRLGRLPLWLGARYARAQTTVRLREDRESPDVPAADRDLTLGALTPALTYDTRDNLFTPTRGLYLDASASAFRQSLGSDRDFDLLQLHAMYFLPIGAGWHFAIRAAARDSSQQTPFFLRPYVMLRGVQALKYQGERAAELETEFRWQPAARWSAVAFGGAGTARSEREQHSRSDDVTAGGVGFRYLVARTYGLHLGLDVAWGPDDPVLYVVFGSAWLRP